MLSNRNKRILLAAMFAVFTLPLMAQTTPVPSYPKLENPKGFSCNPDLKALDAAAAKIYYGVVENIKADLAKAGIKITKILPDNEKATREFFAQPAVFDYDMTVPVDLITDNGEKLSIYTNVAKSDGEISKSPVMLIPVFVKDTGKGTSCEFEQGKDIPIPGKYLTTFSVVDSSTKKILASGLYDVYSVAAETVSPVSSAKSAHRKKHRKEEYNQGYIPRYMRNDGPRACIICGIMTDTSQFPGCCQ